MQYLSFKIICARSHVPPTATTFSRTLNESGETLYIHRMKKTEKREMIKLCHLGTDIHIESNIYIFIRFYYIKCI